MITFDWATFFENNAIQYSDRGPSTSKDNLYIHCVFCGEADQGRHMGVSIKGKGWGCWREQSHRGRNPARLIQALLGCSWDEANRMAGRKHAISGVGGGLLAAVKLALGDQEGVEKPPALKLPSAFKRFNSSYVKTPHFRYLRKDRRMTVDQIDEISDRYKLRFCYMESGGWLRQWAWRLIVPVFDEAGVLVTWQGRTVGDGKLRYRALSPNEEEGPKAIVPITDCFLSAKRIRKGGRFLVITEGFYDCARISLEAKAFGAKQTCFFGKAISPTQLDQLAEIRGEYEAAFLLLDPDARTSSMRMSSQLRALGVQPYYLQGDEDPGDMSSEKIRKLLDDMDHRISGS